MRGRKEGREGRREGKTRVRVHKDKQTPRRVSEESKRKIC